MNDAMRQRRCPVELPDNTVCDAFSAPDAPFPICVKHASRLLTFLRDLTDVGAGLLGDGQLGVSRAVPPHMVKREVVYYLRGEAPIVKIGWTRDLGQRLRSYPPNYRLIAVEPGSLQTETARLETFADLRIGRREWFHYGPALRAHVELLVAWHGPIKQPPRVPAPQWLLADGRDVQPQRPARGRRRLPGPGQLTIFDALSA